MRLLGAQSVHLCVDGAAAGRKVGELLQRREHAEAARNGRRRMGEPGASRRIAVAVWDALGMGV